MRRIVIPLLLILAGCSKPGIPDATPISIERLPTDQNVIPDPMAGKMVNEFAFDLFAELRKTETGKNILISPYSISNSLGMTTTGARGNTLDQMRKVLHLPDDTIADSNYANLASVLKSGKGYELTTANAVWAQGGKYLWEEPFKKRLSNFGVNTFWEVDFAPIPMRLAGKSTRGPNDRLRKRLRNC